VPFAGGVGANEQEAIASRDAAKGKGDRNALPSNVRPVDTGRGSEAGSSPEDRGSAPATEELSAGRERQNPQRGEVTMQNRDRSRLASVQQMQEIRRGPDPDRLGFSRDP